MTEISPETRPHLSLKFWMQWILANTLGYGLGIGLSALMYTVTADLKEPLLIPIFVFLTQGFWVGLAQLLVLRQILPIRSSWIWGTASVWLISFVFAPLLISLAFVSSLPLLLSLLIFYLVGISWMRWLVYRQFFRPVGSWILIESGAGGLGLILGGGLGLLGYLQGGRLDVVVVIGALIWGTLYGLITALGLQSVIRQPMPQVQQRDDVHDAPPDQQPWGQILINSSSILVFFLWFLVIPKPDFSTGVPVHPLALLIFLFLFSYFCVFIHELGHALFAQIQGSDLRIFAIGRFVLFRTGQGYKLRRSRRLIAGGFAATVPRSLANLNRQILLMISGGPIASFLLFCVGCIPLIFQDLIQTYHLAWFVTLFSGINLHMAIFNTIPLKSGYMHTDGRRILDIIQNNRHGQRFTAFYGYSASLRQGIRPRDVDPQLIEQVLGIPENSMDHISGLLMAYYVALDRGDQDQAGAYLDQALEMSAHYPEIFRGSLLLEGAYFEAQIRQRPEQARQWLDQIPETPFLDASSLLRAEAAVLLAEGDPQAALDKAQQALALAQSDQFMIGGALAEQDYLQELMTQIQQAMATTHEDNC